VTGRPRGLSTRAIHTRPDQAPGGAPVAPPIVTAATFEFDTAERFARVMAEDEYGFLYSRLRNPTVEAVNAVVAALHGAEAAQAFASGMGAVAAALFTNLEPGDTLLMAAQLYGNTYALAEQRLRPLGIDVVYADVTDPGAWRRPARVRYVETIANPGGVVADLAALAATNGEGLFVVDNSVASPALCRPLELGADLVVEAGTKFLGGHHDVTAGVVAGSTPLVARARAWLIDTGAVLDPFAAYLLHRGMKTLALRVERQSASALTVARFLESHPKVARVDYPGLPSHPQHELARRQLDGFGSLVAFEVRGGRAAGERLMDAVELCVRATSFGGVETVISHPASTSHRQFSPEQLATAGVAEGLLRLSVGCEDDHDLLDDLGRALDRV
jgi:methionine-gamma-lyase